MFINDAFAATATAATTATEGGAISGTLIQLALILLIFYFFLIRPQQKKIREHSAMIEALKVGDKVLTSSGIHGKIAGIKEGKIALEIAPGVEITVDRMAIGGIVSEPKA